MNILLSSHPLHISQRHLPISCLQKLGQGDIETLLAEQDEEAEEAQKAFILCRTCRHPITSVEHAIEMLGHHRHVFANPAGSVFEIGCFSLANGCMNYGEPTAQHSWFAAYQWRYALCGNCQAHLGWHFSPSGTGPSFYGLILANLIEEQTG